MTNESCCGSVSQLVAGQFLAQLDNLCRFWLLADDAQFLQGEAHFSGKSEITDKWVKATLGTITNLKTSTVSSEADTHTAYEAGTFSVDVLPAGPGEPEGFGEGNFMLLWKKGADGAWKLSYAQLEDLPVQAKNR